MSEKDENTFSFDDIGKSGDSSGVFGDGYYDEKQDAQSGVNEEANVYGNNQRSAASGPNNSEISYETTTLQDTDFDEFTTEQAQGYSNNDFGIPSQIHNEVRFNNKPGGDAATTVKIAFAVLFVIFIIAVGLFFLPKKKIALPGLNFNKHVSEEVSVDENMNPNMDSNDDISIGTDENIASDEMSEMDDLNSDKDSELNLVSYSIETSENANPFLPFSEANYGKRSAKIPADLIAPPETLPSESQAKQVMATKVSGIMYDSQSPSAILNIDTQDYLVRSGDVINGYKVLLITPNFVTVQLGDNIYKAGVGEDISSKGEVNYNDVYNLQNKFGGANKNKGI